MSKDTKILIPEIPGEWTERTLSGHKCIWNDGWHGKPHRNGLPYVELTAPEKGLYAERIDGAWYWVSGCNKCTGATEGWSYIVCDKHDVCVSCNAHRSTLTDTPWGTRDGFRCKPCQDREDAAAKADALAKFAEAEFDDSDFEYQDECKCPHCATVIHLETEDYGDKNMECETCGGSFELQVEYSVSFTTKVIGERRPQGEPMTQFLPCPKCAAPITQAHHVNQGMGGFTYVIRCSCGLMFDTGVLSKEAAADKWNEEADKC